MYRLSEWTKVYEYVSILYREKLYIWGTFLRSMFLFVLNSLTGFVVYLRFSPQIYHCSQDSRKPAYQSSSMKYENNISLAAHQSRSIKYHLVF